MMDVYFAFLAGIFAFFAACLVPLVPAYLAYLSGISLTYLQNNSLDFKIKRKIFFNSLFFILGFSLIFIFLGAATGFLGQFFRAKRLIFQQIGGIFIILLGIYLLFNSSRFCFLPKRYFTPFAFLNSFLTGMTFSFGWMPCFSPILASILFLASFEDTLWQGIYLLSFFSLGIAVPFLILSLVMGYTIKVWKNVEPYFGIIRIVISLLLITIGILLSAGKWSLLTKILIDYL